MHAPIVVVPCDPIRYERMMWSAAPATYLRALAREGLLPVQLPTLPEPLDPAPLLDAASGVLITGARSNVHPSLYGEAETEVAAPFDPLRDRTSLPLIRAAVERGLPLLAICRGIQELNVAFGGTLHPALHDIEGRLDHRSTPQDDVDAWFGLRHEVEIADGGLLAPVLGRRIVVNSVHRQGIRTLGDGLRVEATAADGTIEAVSIPSAATFALGVQWHPEHFAGRDEPSTAIFRLYADAVRGRAARLSEAA